MTTEEYLKQRIKDLENNVCDSSLPLKFRKNQAFAFLAGAPAAIGLFMADTAVKAANVEIVDYKTPNNGTSYTNEVILAFSGEASDVKSALLAAREVGLELLGSMGSEPKSQGTPYL